MGNASESLLRSERIQTLIATTIFSRRGLGLWGTMGPAMQLVLAFAIFFVNLVRRDPCGGSSINGMGRGNTCGVF